MFIFPGKLIADIVSIARIYRLPRLDLMMPQLTFSFIESTSLAKLLKDSKNQFAAILNVKFQEKSSNMGSYGRDGNV